MHIVLFELFFFLNHHGIDGSGHICGMESREGSFESFLTDVFGYTEKGGEGKGGKT